MSLFSSYERCVSPAVCLGIHVLIHSAAQQKNRRVPWDSCCPNAIHAKSCCRVKIKPSVVAEITRQHMKQHFTQEGSQGISEHTLSLYTIPKLAIQHFERKLYSKAPSVQLKKTSASYYFPLLIKLATFCSGFIFQHLSGTLCTEHFNGCWYL